MTERFRYREQTRRLAETSADLRSKEGVGGVVLGGVEKK